MTGNALNMRKNNKIRYEISLDEPLNIDFEWAKYHIKERLYDGHKGTYGRIMHVTGGYHYRGAALLAAKAAVYAVNVIV